MKILLLDDEVHCNKIIEHHLLKSRFAEAEIVKMNDPVEAVAYIQNHEIDLLFLDIDMPILNGFDVLGKLKDIDFEFIIVTAYDHFAMQAIKASAIDYLLKPILLKDFEIAINKFNERYNNTNQSNGQLFKKYVNEIRQNKFDKLVLPIKSGFMVEDYENVFALEADGEYTHVLLKGSEKILVSKNLGYFEKLLPVDFFVRIHRKHIVNVSKIRYLGKENGGTVKLVNGTSFAVSRSKYEVVKSIFSL